MKTTLAIILYGIVLGTFAVCAVIIVIRLLTFPPCTQTSIANSVCAVDSWSIAGLASTILGTAATVLALLGGFAVAAWWADLNKRVTKRVTKLYGKQKVEIDNLVKNQQQQLQINIDSSQNEINKINQLMDDIEEILVDSFVAMGPLFSEAAARKAVGMNRLLRFPYSMTKTYLDLLEIEIPREREGIKKEIAQFTANKQYVHLSTNTQTTLEGQRRNFLEQSRKITDQPLSLSSATQEYWTNASYWLNIAINNKEQTPRLTAKIEELQGRFNLCNGQINELTKDLDPLQVDIKDIVTIIGQHLQLLKNQRTP